MVDWLRRGIKAFYEKGGIFMFMRAQFSSQIASVTDFLVTILSAKLFSLYYVYATCLGSVCGGIINGLINYKWTFKSKGNSKIRVLIKYTQVWLGSIALNTWGTFALTETIAKYAWVQELLRHYIYDLYLFSKVVVSLLVGFIWNYNMQRIFVYKRHNVGEMWQKIRTK